MPGNLPELASAAASGRGVSRLLRDQRGTVAIEFAYVLVAFLTILFGIIAFGFQFAARVALSYAVAEGGRAAEVGLSSSERQSLANTAVANVLNSFSPLIDPSKARINVASQGTTPNGEAILVSISYSDNRFNVFPFVPNLNAASAVQTTFFVADPSRLTYELIQRPHRSGKRRRNLLARSQLRHQLGGRRQQCGIRCRGVLNRRSDIFQAVEGVNLRDIHCEGTPLLLSNCCRTGAGYAISP